MLYHKPIPYHYTPKFTALSLILKIALLGLLYFHPLLKVLNNWLLLLFGFILGMPVGFLAAMQIEHYFSTEESKWGRSIATVIKQVYISLLWVATFLLLYFVIYMPEIMHIPLHGLVLLMMLTYMGYLLAKDIILLIWFAIKE